MNVYLSYAQSDRQFAVRLAQDLTREGIDVWFDTDELKPGENWVQTLLSVIRRTPIFIALISANTATSPWFTSELATALASAESAPESRKIIPVVIEQGAEIPPFLGQFQALDISQPSSYEQGVRKLVEALKSPLPSPEMLARYEQLQPDIVARMLRTTEHAIEQRGARERSEIIRKNIGQALVLSFLGVIAVSVFVALGEPNKFSILLSFLSGLLFNVIGSAASFYFSRKSAPEHEGANRVASSRD